MRIWTLGQTFQNTLRCFWDMLWSPQPQLIQSTNRREGGAETFPSLLPLSRVKTKKNEQAPRAVLARGRAPPNFSNSAKAAHAALNLNSLFLCLVFALLRTVFSQYKLYFHITF